MSDASSRLDICSGCITSISNRFMLAYTSTTHIAACGFCGQLRDIVAKAAPPRTLLAERGTKMKGSN